MSPSTKPVNPVALGRPLHDAELASFSGGKCTVTITVHRDGSTSVKYEGDCKGVQVK